MEQQRMQASILSVAPIFVSNALECNHPITRKPPSPVPRCHKQKDNRKRPYAGVKRPQKKSDRREYTPVGVIYGHVFIKQTKSPDNNSCQYIRKKQSDNGTTGLRASGQPIKYQPTTYTCKYVYTDNQYYTTPLGTCSFIQRNVRIPDNRD